VIIAEDVDNDGFINIVESTAPVDVQVMLPVGAAVGEVLTITLDGVTSSQVLSAVNVTAGVVNVNTATPAHSAVVVADAYLTDPAGNVSPTDR